MRGSTSGVNYKRICPYIEIQHRVSYGISKARLSLQRFQSAQERLMGSRMTASSFSNIFELAQAVSASRDLEGDGFLALERVYEIRTGSASCEGTPELANKFGVDQQDTQTVVCVTERYGHNQVWWNRARTKKPQTFKSSAGTEVSVSMLDSTNDGQNCDFCSWETLTATDTFGRIQNESCASASNLFKFAFPCHGLIIFKHHQPLQFTHQQVHDLLVASCEWFQQASRSHPQAAWPLFLWNCLPRAGASQFHGHAQVTLTEVPTPEARLLQELGDRLKSDTNNDGSYGELLLQAHKAVGLARSITSGDERCECFASLAPFKDMELVILASNLKSRAFAGLLHACLRSLIECLGATSFNVGIHNISLAKEASQPIMARGSLSSKASDFGGLEVFGGASIGHTDPYAVIAALDSYCSQASGVKLDP